MPEGLYFYVRKISHKSSVHILYHTFFLIATSKLHKVSVIFPSVYTKMTYSTAEIVTFRRVYEKLGCKFSVTGVLFGCNSSGVMRMARKCEHRFVEVHNLLLKGLTFGNLRI